MGGGYRPTPAGNLIDSILSYRMGVLGASFRHFYILFYHNIDRSFFLYISDIRAAHHNRVTNLVNSYRNKGTFAQTGPIKCILPHKNTDISRFSGRTRYTTWKSELPEELK
jgi:hypothetical protein